MHEFRSLLSKYLKENRHTQQWLAARLDADQATVSRWLSGHVEMAPAKMGEVLALVSSEERGPLLEAYLRDRIPSGCEQYVELKSAKDVPVELRPRAAELEEFPRVMDPELKKRLVLIANMALKSTDVRKLIGLIFKAVKKLGV